MKKHRKPRKRDGELRIDVTLKEGNTPILEFREKKVSALEEVIEMLKRKL